MPFGVSLVIHALLLLLILVLPAHLPKEEKPLVIEAWPTAPAEVEKMVSKPKGKLRIADIDKPAEQKRPSKAKFAGLYDSSVEKETVSRHGGRGSGAGRGKTVGKGSGKKVAKAGKKKANKLLDVDQNLFAMREPASPSQSQTSRLSSRVGKVSIGGSGGGDFFPDIKVGDHTYLNVLRYPEISYFVRLKRVFRMTFNPGPPLRDYFSTNRVASGSVNVVLGVSVNGAGRLAELFVLRSSGIPAYDQEALRTVRASAPFSRPPEKFLAKDGALRMMWTFTVYL